MTTTRDLAAFARWNSEDADGRHIAGAAQNWTNQTAPCVELKGVRKVFGSVVALQNGRLSLHSGEVHALLGENGAGKSTLVKILAGVHAPSAGEFRVNGQPARFQRPSDARKAGIAVIYQEPTLFGDLSITENIYMGRQRVDRWGRLQHQEMEGAVAALLGRLGVRLDASRIIRGLSIADQQIVEIAKALSQNAKVLIMDEPTAALSKREVQQMFAIVRRLRDEGVAVLFITHRLEEVFELTQRVTIMRDGACVFSGPTRDLTSESIVSHMVGRALDDYYPRPDVVPGDVVLNVKNLCRAGVFHHINLQVRRGEIVALAGLVGAGRSEVIRAIFGIDPVDSGEVSINGKPLTLGDPSLAVASGLAMVPEDRRMQGLVMQASIARNATLTIIDRLTRFGFMPRRSEAEAADHWGKKLKLKSSDLQNPVSTLSGGNQQKVVIGKWLATNPIVLFIDEPTRGIDVGAKAEVYRTMKQLVEDGLAVLMVSSELPEVLGMADRVLVLHEGRITAELLRGEMNEESIMAAALGHAPNKRVGVNA
jgi:rhamnose transport system ATP-binding protein